LKDLTFQKNGKNIQNFFTNKIVHSLINEKLLIRYKIVEKY